MTATEQRAPYIPRRAGRPQVTDHRGPDLKYVTDESLKALISNVERLRSERGAANGQYHEAEAALSRAAVTDRDAAAEAIRSGSPIPKDEAAVAANAQLTEALKYRDRVDLAWENELHNLERLVPSLRGAEITNLQARIDTAQTEAATALASLREQVRELDRMKVAALWFSRFPHGRDVTRRTRWRSDAEDSLDAVGQVIATPAIPRSPEQADVGAEVDA